MTRSILPSTSRYATKVRPLIHRAARHAANAAVRAMVRDPAEWENGVDEPDSMQREIGGLVGRRRSSDKLNHFERWAVERTRELPAEVRLGHLAGVLPPGLIGDHAYGHLEHRRELMSEEQYRLKYPWRMRDWRRKRERLDRGEAAVLLRRLLVTAEGHAWFNRELKAAVAREQAGQPKGSRPLPAVRVLLGLHDVLPFLRAAERGPYYRHVDSLLRQLKARVG